MCSFNPNITNYYTCNGQHVHEFTGSTLFTDTYNCCHNHRFAAISGEAIPAQGSHFHNLCFRTDSYANHWHEYQGPSTLAIPTGDGHHIHFINGTVTDSSSHVHEFRTASLINDPTDHY